MHHRSIHLAAAAVLATTLTACGDSSDTTTSTPTSDAADGTDEQQVSLSLGDTNTNGPIEGSVAVLDVGVEGVRLTGADGDTSGATGHLHVFVDRAPLDVGVAIPKQDGILHTTDPFLEVSGLTVGEHRVVVVLGDGTHTRIHEEALLDVTFEVVGPTLQVSAPDAVAEGEAVVLDVTVEGADIVGADGDTSGNSGHLHVFVDRHPRDVGLGEAIPKEDGIIHTTDTRIEVPDLAPGEHTLWVVLGDGTHTTSWGDPVADRVTVTVG